MDKRCYTLSSHAPQGGDAQSADLRVAPYAALVYAHPHIRAHQHHQILRCEHGGVHKEQNLHGMAAMESGEHGLDDRFGDQLLRHVAICHDVLLEETIRMRQALRRLLPIEGGAGATEVPSVVFDTLDRLLPLRPIRHATADVINWIDFVRDDSELNSVLPSVSADIRLSVCR